MAESQHVSALKSQKAKPRQKNKKNKTKQVNAKLCYRQYPNGAVIYIGHLPHGFYERELHRYFSQFGEVGRIQLCRSKKTHKSKGYAFIEFESKSVAEIAADAMNNYLMFQKLIKCHVVPDEKVNPNLFKHSRQGRYYVLPYVKHRDILRQPQTDEKLKVSIKKIKSKRNKLREKLSQLGISYDLVPLSKQAQDKNTVEVNDENLVPEKKKQLNSPQRKEADLLSDSPDSKTLNKTVLKKKRQMSESDTQEEEQLEPDVCSKKQKLTTPESKKHKDLPGSAKVNTSQKADLQTSAKKASLKVQRQASEDNDDSELPVKKQRLTSPKIKKMTADTELMKSAGKVADLKKGALGTPKSGTISTAKGSPQVVLKRIPDSLNSGKKIQKKEEPLPHNVEITEREDIKEVALSAKKRKISTPKANNKSLMNTPTTKETTPPAGQKSAKKVTADTELMKSAGKVADVKKGALSTPKSGTISTAKGSPQVVLKRIPDSLNSGKKIQKKEEPLPHDVEITEREDIKEVALSAKKRKISTPKANNKSLMNTPTTKETTPPAGQKSAKKMTADTELMKSAGKVADMKKGALSTPKSGTISTAKGSPQVVLKRIPDSLNSGKKIQKKKLVQDVERNEDDTDHSTPGQNQKITAEKNKKSPSLDTHVTTESKTPNAKKVQTTATKLGKKLSQETSLSPDQSTPNTRLTRSTKKTNAKITSKQGKQAEEHDELDSTPETMIRVKQSVSTPSTRVMRSSKNQIGVESPLVDGGTPTKLISTPKHKSCSVKKKV